MRPHVKEKVSVTTGHLNVWNLYVCGLYVVCGHNPTSNTGAILLLALMTQWTNNIRTIGTVVPITFKTKGKFIGQ